MASRCPTSSHHSFGVLRGYRWIIGERGYANIIKSIVSSGVKTSPLGDQRKADGQEGVREGLDKEEMDGEDAVYGMLYSLEEKDEENLDVAEGVPYAYVKRELDVDLLSREDGREEGGEGGPGSVKALVYVDEKRLGEGVCREEYVARMNRGIRDAMGKGMGKTYVEKVLRPFVREEKVGEVMRDPFHPETFEASEEFYETEGRNRRIEEEERRGVGAD